MNPEQSKPEGVVPPELRISFGNDRLPPALERLSLGLGGRLVGHASNVVANIFGEAVHFGKGAFHLRCIGRSVGEGGAQRRQKSSRDNHPRGLGVRFEHNHGAEA